VPIVLKSESLNLLEPSGPVKACNGIALPYWEVVSGQTIPQQLYHRGHQDCHLTRCDAMYCVVKGNGVPVRNMKVYGGVEV
jgi:hypothetical protein